MIYISLSACERFCIAQQATGLTREQAVNACELGRIGIDPSVRESVVQSVCAERSRQTNGIAIMAVLAAAIQPSLRRRVARMLPNLTSSLLHFPRLA
ncbi:hypothetical protein [Paraburkholderia bannensis]|uniref:hypothetical protein n=1 Tax=Paraburkholderia bannensis TaxID=765414 RepID=UPI002AB7780B|nr:hypothetical protein [Paraburkholderia bannensis]